MPTLGPFPLGIYANRPNFTIPRGGVTRDSIDFRIQDGDIFNGGLGDDIFSLTLPFDVTPGSNEPIMSAVFTDSDGEPHLIIGTHNDLIVWRTSYFAYLNPTYSTGTVNVSAANPAVVTLTGGNFTTAGVAAGDRICFGTDSGHPSDDHPVHAVNGGAASDWYVVASKDNDTQLTLTTAVSGAPLTGSVYTVRFIFQSLSSVLPIAQWSWDVFNNADPDGENLWIAANGVDNPVKWNGSDLEVTSLSLGFIPRYVATFSNMMVYGHIFQGGVYLPTDIINSDIGQPEDVSTGLSEQFRVYGGTANIINMKRLGDNLVIYTNAQQEKPVIVVAQFVGDPFVLAFRTAVNGHGLLAPRAIADFGDYHMFAAKDGMYIFDGTSLAQTGKHVWPYVWRSVLDFDHLDNFHSVYDTARQDLIWAIPDGSGTGSTVPGQAWVVHYGEEGKDSEPPISRRNYNYTTSIRWERLTESPIIACSQDGYAFRLYEDDTRVDPNDYADLDSADRIRVQTKVYLPMEPTVDGERKGFISQVWPYIFSTSGHTGGDTEVTLKAYAFDNPVISGDYTTAPTPYTATGSITVDFSDNSQLGLTLDTRFLSRWVAFGFELTEGTPSPSIDEIVFRLTGLKYDIKAGGRR